MSVPNGTIPTFTAVDRRWAITQDAADQLRSVISYSGTSSTVVEKWGYAYDPAGNRSYEEHDGTGTPITTGNANRLQQRGGAGSLRVSGTVDKAATVTINNQPARVTSTGGAAPFLFEKDLAVTPGAQTFTIAATDGSTPPQTTTQTYSVTVPATYQTYEHDTNGNLRHIRTGGTTTLIRSYEWDAADRLVKIIYADNGSTTFQYDGLSQRRVITEYAPDGTTVTSTTRLLWLEGRVWQEQDSTARVTRRYHFNGSQTLTYTGASTTPANTTSTLTLSDHLGNHREVVTLVSNVPALIGRRDYDPYGKATQTGVVPTSAAYTGHWLHERSGLELALYRAYDPELGRWLNEDPIQEAGGLNLYGYVGNGPVKGIDPLGLADGSGGSSITEFTGRGTSDLHVHPIGREPPNPAYAIDVDKNGALTTCKRGNHPFNPVKAEADLADKLNNPSWVEKTRKKIASQWDSASGSVQKKLESLGRAVRKAGSAAKKGAIQALKIGTKVGKNMCRFNPIGMAFEATFYEYDLWGEHPVPYS